ncbi:MULTISPECIES: TetR/AcrR family transcriptional regulator [unclassified Spirillospora]|uniref:TetR/AcrR family transcriptional regulator n=1 Tax=unclassified Spirillospora TaxID=2642701 RepID=UPI003720D39B
MPEDDHDPVKARLVRRRHGLPPPALGYAAQVVDRAVAGGKARSRQAGQQGGGQRGGRGRRRLSVDERREELIAAALQLFSTRSPEDISIDDVAAAAGASRALVYHYFGGKYELYIAALGSAAKQLSVLLEPPTEGKPLDRLRISLRRYFDFVERHAAGYTALLRGGPADRSGEVGEIVDGIRRLLLDRILHSLDVETPQPILRITLRSWMAAVETAGLDWLENRDVTRAGLESLLVDHLVVMLHAAGRHDPGTANLFDRLSQEEMNS